jgi:hypothetical protein
MKFVGNIFLFLLCTFSVFGQENITLSGTIVDKADNEPIVAGSVELLNAKDSVFVAGAISSIEGAFSFKNLSAGRYIVRITYIGYNTFLQSLRLSSQKTSVDMGKLFLETNDILLQEAVIEGKKPEVIVKNDTIEYDAGSYKVSENAVVEDLLKKLPGVEVDKDGKITVNGKEIKKIMVDNKEFFSDDPQIASKNLPAEMVDKLQVVDRKSDMARMTGFDDGEEQTIINLTIRPGMKKGTMGNVLLGAGADANDDLRYQGAAFLNHMKDNDRYTLIIGKNNNNNMGAADLGANQFGGMRMRRGGSGGVTENTNFMLSINKELSPVASLNSDIRYNGANRFSENNVSQMTLSTGQSQLDQTKTATDYFSDNLSANFTFEWKPDSMNTLIFRPNVRYNSSHSYETEESQRYNYNDMSPIFDSDSESKNQGEGISLGGSLDYAYKFHKPGRVFSINLQGSYSDSYSQENAFTRNIKYEESSLKDKLDQRSENDDNTNNYRLTVSYVEPLGRNNFLQGVYRISYLDTKSINSTYDLWDDIMEYDPMLALSILADSVATLLPEQSRSTLRHSTEQRFGLNFKSVREKFNYTVGLNIDPTRSTNETYQPAEDKILILPYWHDKRLINNRGDVQLSSIPREVVNFSPVINFNYIFGQRTNLRIDYEGTTNQPSASQLRDFVDMSRPTDWNKGNPDLKPGYSNTLRARFSKYVSETQLTYNLNLNGNLSVNDITSVTLMQEGGIRLTTYENINGNWNTQLRGMFNMPLKNKKFTIGNFSTINYRNQNSYVANLTEDKIQDKIQNTMRNLTLMTNTNINYRSDLFDIGLNASINYNHITYNVQTENNQNTYNFGIGGYTTWYLPHNLVIDSDINWTARTGYTSGFNIPELIWNAAVTKQIFNKKIGTGSLKLQVFDILQNRNNITSSYTTNGFRTSEMNVIPRYFMCSFIYKFTLFPKSSSATEEDLRGGRRGGGPGGPGGGGPDGGGRPF